MESFNPSRLDVARKRRGLSKTQLARDANISTRIITDYEKGDKTPGPATLGRLATVLGFGPEFFHGSDIDEPSVQGASFRSLSRMTARQRDQALGSAALAMEFADWLAARFDLPPCAVPRLRGVEPETAAEEVRIAWGLGQKPAPNMIHLLEANGVRVFSLPEETAEVDAFSFWRQGVPFIFLNTSKSAERSRMDAAHELGHLILHWRGGTQGREAESEAQAFGAAFLMPRESVLAEAPRGGRIEQIVVAKRRWKVAAVNLAFRMHKLGLLTDWQYRSVFIEMSKRGYRTNEPKSVPHESSQLLAKAFASLREHKLTTAEIAHDLRLPVDELNKLVFGLVLTPVAGEGQQSPGPRAGSSSLRLVE